MEIDVFSLNSNILSPHPRPRPPRQLHCKHCSAPAEVPFKAGIDNEKMLGFEKVEVYTGGNPKIGGKHPKMDGENNGKPY